MMQEKPLALFLMGPTAAGKTNLAMSLVEQGQCEIISVDSAQIYKGMDIGTATPTAEELARAPHHLIDICDPSESYSAVQFRNDALELMAQITARGKVPLLTGGTMLYFKTLVEPLAEMPPSNEGVRAAIQHKLASEGLQALVDELQRVDPVAHGRIELQNPQRVQRALEVYRVSGKPISSFWAEGSSDGKGKLSAAAIEAFPYRLQQYAVIPNDRKVLHERIARRYHQMIDMGFEQEARLLFERGDLHLDLPSIRSVGYRQMWQYFLGEYNFDEMVERGIIATRQLAKRQLTWLRGWPELQEIDIEARSTEQWCAKILADSGI
ncbi:tRNA (adenosine(37)-N6)-dimethylallyltransferase MiaA [Reinekea marinisedimentorum]|uniref:tRNA dimethylallyltransferase n=1 Tax=Reinekea marinisedimentorum TaxID=230495 RepID=A0A4V2UK60_9GAMM|nr:tRNA (adenosine(37)-N6)-dimethylallyltransferase MiaA [Reinekea marinisedimentorum]TCS42992.1 tRNA dimethylallyltransferase [Reinekea marinisedimentorum]